MKWSEDIECAKENDAQYGKPCIECGEITNEDINVPIPDTISKQQYDWIKKIWGCNSYEDIVLCSDCLMISAYCDKDSTVCDKDPAKCGHYYIENYIDCDESYCLNPDVWLEKHIAEFKANQISYDVPLLKFSCTYNKTEDDTTELQLTVSVTSSQ